MTFINWNGDEVVANVVQAAQEAIDETTQAAAEDANGTSLDLPPHSASGFPWYGVTPRDVGSVVSEEAEVKGSTVTGRFGDTAGAGDYGLFLERLQPYLRPAADREFPQLAERIQKRLE